MCILKGWREKSQNISRSVAKDQMMYLVTWTYQLAIQYALYLYMISLLQQCGHISNSFYILYHIFVSYLINFFTIVT